MTVPFLTSSRIRSKINTLASTDMPTVKTIPAMPGKVNVACNKDKTAKMITTFKDQRNVGNKAEHLVIHHHEHDDEGEADHEGQHPFVDIVLA